MVVTVKVVVAVKVVVTVKKRDRLNRIGQIEAKSTIWVIDMSTEQGDVVITKI